MAWIAATVDADAGHDVVEGDPGEDLPQFDRGSRLVDHHDGRGRGEILVAELLDRSEHRMGTRFGNLLAGGGDRGVQVLEPPSGFWSADQDDAASMHVPRLPALPTILDGSRWPDTFSSSLGSAASGP